MIGIYRNKLIFYLKNDQNNQLHLDLLNKFALQYFSILKLQRQFYKIL